jgi:hypothetical protein
LPVYDWCLGVRHVCSWRIRKKMEAEVEYLLDLQRRLKDG